MNRLLKQLPGWLDYRYLAPPLPQWFTKHKGPDCTGSPITVSGNGIKISGSSQVPSSKQVAHCVDYNLMEPYGSRICPVQTIVAQTKNVLKI
jgi:hypothetical protein